MDSRYDSDMPPMEADSNVDQSVETTSSSEEVSSTGGMSSGEGKVE